jgi:hypothetical protein
MGKKKYDESYQRNTVLELMKNPNKDLLEEMNEIFKSLYVI